MPNGYDRLARWYDHLSQIIYFGRIQRAQAFGLESIQPKSKVLIVGGGTGLILEHIARLDIQRLQIDYVEASPAMIDMARKRVYGANEINFIASAWPDVDAAVEYDVIITQFFLDSFQDSQFDSIFSSLDECLKTDGFWIVADFQLSKGIKRLWQQSMLVLMYLFFKFTVGISASRLEDIQDHFKRKLYQRVEYQLFFGAFIFSSVYQKMNK